MRFTAAVIAALFTASLPLSGCFGKKGEEEAAASSTGGGESCKTLTGSAWVPDVTGAGDANHDDAGVTVYPITKVSGSAQMIGLNQAYSDPTHVVTVSIAMPDDLLEAGSLSLVAEVSGVDAALTAEGLYVYPSLISLHDGTNELVKITGCSGAGFYTASSACSASSSVTRIATCGPDAGSAYLGDTMVERRGKWQQQQNILSEEQMSVNSFPTCSWSNTSGVGSALTCPFTSTFFSGGRLRSGVTYTAKYVMLTNSYVCPNGTGLFEGNPNATLTVSVVRKKDGNAGAGSKGALDLNVVLVGTKNIEDSRTDKGKANLNALFTHVYNHYFTNNQSSTGVKLGRINVYEWTCENGGDAYADVEIELTGEMFRTGSALLPSSTEARALNVFLVSTIPYGGLGTILGKAGGIPGSMINGTTMSGAVFSTFNSLASYNPACPSSGTCPPGSQEYDFVDMASTVSHEMGHFLGLNHPTESSGGSSAQGHDKVPDTPVVYGTQTIGGSSYVTHTSARQDAIYPAGERCGLLCTGYNGTGVFCPAVAECQFNHVMWWTAKNFQTVGGNGDGNIFSTNSGTIINYSPYVQ
jgi:hypothetical protein